MKIQFAKKPSKNALIIKPVFQKERSGGVIAQLAKNKEFEGKTGQTFFLFEKRTVLLGLGDAKKMHVGEIMTAFGQAVKSAAAHHGKTVAVEFPSHLHAFAQAVAEALILGAYQASAPYKTGASQKKLASQKVETVEIIGISKHPGVQTAMEKGAAIANAVNEVRDWVNAPPNFANAKFFDEKAQEIAKETGAKLTILRKKELEKLNMGALLGVNRGSPDEARLTILDYSPAALRQSFDKLRMTKGDKEPPIVFVGKGILFDSGGYNLKPRGYIEDMQLDKAGAAAVLALIKLLPKLGVKRRVIGIAPFTENLIGRHALKPSEILKTYSGKTIEITNTDGEGRLVLADAIAYAIDQFKPKFLVDIATLTGACMVALGPRYAGLFGNDEKLSDQLREAGNEVDELLWPLPLHKDYSKKMKGHYADLRNADLGSERDAGASKGAAFIQEFIGKTKWAHLDIAGPAWTTDPKKYEQKGATGFGVRVLVRFLEKI